MNIKDKVKQSLKLCRDTKCERCKYNVWVRDMCWKILRDDAIKLIEEPN